LTSAEAIDEIVGCPEEGRGRSVYRYNSRICSEGLIYTSNSSYKMPISGTKLCGRLIGKCLYGTKSWEK
jgi:hypothetical protein